MPKQIVLAAPEKLAWIEFEKPVLGPAMIWVEPELGLATKGNEMAFCKGYRADRGQLDSELRIFDRSPLRAPHPCGIGNIFIGPVIDFGRQVSCFKLGDAVYAHGAIKEIRLMEEKQASHVPEEAGQAFKTVIRFPSRRG